MQENDIYVHASDVEAEGLACLEALSCGNVPIISSSPRSAASQFALDERSKFAKGDFPDLRDKLDYWIEHPKERWVMRKKYAELGRNYTINKSAQKLLEMFAEAIERNKRRQGKGAHSIPGQPIQGNTVQVNRKMKRNPQRSNRAHESMAEGQDRTPEQGNQ
jgi:hypothetical protein